MTSASYSGIYDPLDTNRLLDDSYSSKSFATPDVALLACPISTSYCGAVGKVVEIGSLAGDKAKGIPATFEWAVEVSPRVHPTPQMHQCSIIVKSKCGAPTFDIDTVKSVSEAGKTAAELWSVSYMEYSQPAPVGDAPSDFPARDLVLKPEDLTLDPSLYKGGMLYDVSVWYQGTTNPLYHSMLTPAQIILDWMAPYITDIKTYNGYIREGGAYQQKTLFWNSVYARNATRDYYSADGGADGKPVGPTEAALNASIPWQYTEEGE